MICNSLIEDDKFIQPIYIVYNLDNSSIRKFWVRRNRKQELNAMNQIKNRLIEKFPKVKDKLLPTWFINKEIKNNEFTNYFNNENLFPRKRKVHQYEHMARISYTQNKLIDVGVLGVHEKTKFIEFLKLNLIKRGNNKIIPFEHPLKMLNFPIFGFTKQELFINAEKKKFDDILKLSWSCWFPRNNGKPCNRCPMCIERII